MVNIDKMGQPMVLGRNWLENIVLDCKNVFSGARLTGNDYHYKEQHCNRPSLSNHYAKPEHDTHSKNIVLSKPRSNKRVKLLKLNTVLCFNKVQSTI